ncbi:precorrin-3B C(17)-methyltransferase [Eubacterium pyruvativorans]|uniref:precorrin-3B C(17)-methyltransferase n=1 Tax=Eubacterium pyruvativorans TaxID=155865 RepID=UPI003F8CE2B8
MSKLYAVGIGPGRKEFMTEEALEALNRSELIFGYTVYADQVRGIFPEKEYITTPMKQEIDRCRMALEAASAGRTTAMVCSGDAGVYGMAGLLIQLESSYPGAEVEVVAGVTAGISGAAVLGAPLGHDFCVISLSDLLTPWEVIEKRLRAAARGDFALCLYNPRSKKRRDHLARAVGILLEEGKSPDTVCGWVRQIGRTGQEQKVMTLAQLKDEPVDMFTTVFVGSGSTKRYGSRMVTPRGYEKKQ